MMILLSANKFVDNKGKSLLHNKSRRVTPNT